MAEGRAPFYYQSDLLKMNDAAGADQPAEFQFEVPNNLSAQAALGWHAAPGWVPSAVGPPNGFRPRHAVGKNAAGKRVRAICATVACDLWTNVANTWTYVDNAGATQTATRTGRVGEAARG